MRVLLTVEYYGKNYAGWQRQKNVLTVQEVIENVLSDVLKQKIIIIASGRTDSGVHALGQKAHFDFTGTFPVPRLACAVNTYLPDDIRILDAKSVADDFHAQYSAKRKTYRYRFYLSRTLLPLKNLLAAQIPHETIDFTRMQTACRDLIGTHNFKGFSSTGSGIQTTIRTVYDAHLTQNGSDIELTVTGNGFLYNMVRIIAGTLVWIGLNKLPLTAIVDVLTTQNRKKAGKTFPAHGLSLVNVEYE